MNMLCMNNNAMFPCVREEDTAEQVGVYTATVPLKVKYHENIHLSSTVMNMLCMNNNAMFPCIREEDTAEQVGVYVQPLSL